MIYRYLVAIVGLFNLSHALDVQLVKKHYDVDPENIIGINHSIGTASIIGNEKGLNSIGSYTASTAIKLIHIKHHEGVCYADKFELELKGVMTLPRLKMGNYLLTVRQAFEEEYLHLQAHEYQHEDLWKNSLVKFEKDIKALKIQDNEECTYLINEINQKMALTLSDIIQKNIQFDCNSYGYQLGLPECTQNRRKKLH